MLNDDEGELLRSVALQTAHTILRARLRAERVLEQTKAELEDKTKQLEHSLSVLRATSRAAADRPGLRKVATRIYEEEYVRETECRPCIVTEKIPLKIFTARPDGAKDYFNEQWLDYSGLCLVQLVGWEWTKLIHLDDADETIKRWRQCLGTGEPFRMESRLKEAKGDYRWHLTQAEPKRDVTGKIWMWIGFCMDIHEIKARAEKETGLFMKEQTMRKEALRANHSKDEFFAMLSHELRNPLNAILGWSQLMLQGKMSSDGIRRGIETIERNAQVQNKLIEDLFEMSRITSGKVALELLRLDLSSLTEAIIESAEPIAEAKKIRLRKMIDPEVGPVLADHNRLQQVIWNLLSNAMKFTPHGGEVEIRVTRQPSRAEIKIKDSGIGIKPEFLSYVFDRFRQSDSPSVQQHKGLGLGLAIVKELVLLHRGTVLAESDGEGKGATFTITLPLIQHQDTGTGIDHPASVPLIPEKKYLPLKALTLLVIDDEEDSLELAQEILVKQGGEVITAGSAAEGLEVLKSQRPDVIVCNISMPGKNGYHFIREVRSLPESRGGRVPAVALTGFARPEDRTKAMIAGYQKHVAKPIDASKLVDAIVKLTTARVGSPDKPVE